MNRENQENSNISYDMSCVPELEMMALLEISKAVNSTLDLDKVLEIIIKETIHLFSAEAGSVMLVNDEGLLEIRAASGLSKEIMKKTRVKPGEGIAGWVFQTGKVLLLDGKVSDPRFVKLIDRKDDILSSLAVPLKSREKIIGVLMVRRSGPTRYDKRDLNLISLIADQVAVAIENAALYEEEIEKSIQLRKLNKALAAEKLKIEKILTSMADGVLVTDPKGEIILVNRAALRYLRKDEKEILGQHYDSIFPGKCCLEDVLDAIHTKGIRYQDEISIVFDDEEFHFRILATGLKLPDEEHESVVAVIQNITEMKRIDRMKTEFVSMVSHELRTPLTSIKGFTELLIHREFPRERQHRYLNIIFDDTARLMRLINNLLDLAKLESGQISFHPEAVNPAEIIPGILESFEGQDLKHELKFEIEGEIPTIMIDKDMLINVLTNLVANGLKYSPGGDMVIVKLLRQEGFLKFSVIDHGIGIEPDKREKIFDKFFRVDSSLTRETGGTGLGLATVKYIVHGFGGKIWVESELGKGSEFIFTIPLED